jgi:uncharacterized protein (TIGR02246 family)
MRRLCAMTFFAVLIGVQSAPALAAGATETELMQVATDLGHQYDAHYAAKDPAAMASLYAEDGVLISPAGPIVRGRDAIKSYYGKRFASGARSHAIKVIEVHVQGDGGYGINQFSVTVRGTDGSLHEEHGIIVAVYRHDTDGWHLSLIAPSVPTGDNS